MNVSLLTAMATMQADLTAADASRRQLDGVRTWRAHIADAVQAAAACGSSAGTSAAVTDCRTHRSWLQSCAGVVHALDVQVAAADAIRSAAEAEASSADTAAERSAAEQRARRAAAWTACAAGAAAFGRQFADREDAITRPVGEAIAAAGGLSEVAQVKDYHQGTS